MYDTMYNKMYDDGGTVHLRDTRQVLDPSSLEEAAHKRIPGGSVARYTAQTQGGDERHLARYIPGEGGKTKRRQVTTEGIREAIRNTSHIQIYILWGPAKTIIGICNICYKRICNIVNHFYSLPY